MKKTLLSLGLVLAGFTSFAQFNCGFEASEGYTLGPTPQGVWGSTTLTTNREISADYASAGTQALKLSGNGGTDHNRAGVVSSISEVSAGVVEVVFKAYYLPDADQANNGSDFFFAPQSPAESTVVTYIRLAYDQKVMVVDYGSDGVTPAWTDTGYTFEFNQWNDFKMVIDFSGGIIEYYMNGALIYTGNVWTAATKVGNLAVTNDNYLANCYFDEISYYDPSVASVANQDISKLTVSPNPAKDVLTISNQDTTFNSIEVTDLNGRVVAATKPNAVETTQVNIADLSAGVYMVKIVSDKGTVTKKIIKN